MGPDGKAVLGVGCFVLMLGAGSLATCAGCFAHFLDKAKSEAVARKARRAIPIPESPGPAEDSSLRRLRSKGTEQFVVADEALLRDDQRLAGRSKALCKEQGAELDCRVLVWPAASLVPKSQKISEKQARAIGAFYVRSADRQHECFQLFHAGKRASDLGECETDRVGIEESVTAWHDCKQSILGRLRAPSTAEFVDDDSADRHVFLEPNSGTPADRASSLAKEWAFGSTTYIVQGEVDAQNGFGARLRSPFECSVTGTKEGRWMVTQARVLPR